MPTPQPYITALFGILAIRPYRLTEHALREPIPAHTRHPTISDERKLPARTNAEPAAARRLCNEASPSTPKKRRTQYFGGRHATKDWHARAWRTRRRLHGSVPQFLTCMQIPLRRLSPRIPANWPSCGMLRSRCQTLGEVACVRSRHAPFRRSVPQTQPSGSLLASRTALPTPNATHVAAAASCHVWTPEALRQEAAAVAINKMAPFPI